jgi:mono/diheme cytochrome c family protein
VVVLPGVVILGFLPAVVGAQSAPSSSAGAQDTRVLAQRVGTILADHCVSCHGPEQKKGGLDLSRRSTALVGGKSGNAIVPGEPEMSLVVEKVSEGEMPPKGALSREQLATVRAWVEAGATYASEPLMTRRAGDDWWSLRPIRKVAPAHFSGADAAWIKSSVDAFILARLKSHGLSPAPRAEPLALIRRLTFDLTGLPPTPDEVDAFVADKNPLAYEHLVDRLLASPHYGERWGRHWLDVVRFGESHGYETNLPRPSAWPYRDYVIRAFNRDTPFPQFVFEQLAADTLLSMRAPLIGDRPGHSERGGARATVDWLTEAATGFLVGGTHDIVGNQTVEGMLQQRADDLDDMITATGTTFLGLTVQCARCHDHKFDPILQTDYYGLQAIFSGINHAEREVAAPDAEGRRQEAAAVAMELAMVEGRLDGHEPLARPVGDTPARPMVNARRNVERFAPVLARMIRLTILATNDKTEPCLDEVEVYSAASEGGPAQRNIGAAAAGAKASASSEYPDSAFHKVAHLTDGRVGNGRSWISRVLGKGSVTVEWPAPVTIDRVVWGRDREEVYRDRLATEYYLEAAVETGKWQVVASSLDRLPYSSDLAAQTSGSTPGRSPESGREQAELIAHQAKLRARLLELATVAKVYAGTFTDPGPTHLLIRGDPTRRGPEVRPAGLKAVATRLVLDPRATEAERRRALARWIADPANPLPARVMVNRVWQYHFGRGIVATPSDFGFNGAAPSHPELLDWLASAYIAGGWQLKPIHRLIVTSAAYRQSSQSDDKALAVDRNNLLLWRMAPRRLEAESIRDAILAASGRLDTRMGGPGYNVWEPNTNYVAVYKPRGELGPDTFRRMVYQFKPRSQPDPTFGAFDCPDAALVAPRRNVSVTALQALNLLNSRFILQQATYFADRLKHEAGPEPARQVERGFALAFGRQTSSIERDAAVSLIATHGAAAFCRALYNANEFVYVP